MPKSIFIFQIDRFFDTPIDVVSQQESFTWDIFWGFDDLEVLPLDLRSLVVFVVRKMKYRG